MKNPWVIVGVLAVVLFGGAIWYSNSASEESNVGVEVKEHIKGNPEATVTLVEYSDFQCPACAAFQGLMGVFQSILAPESLMILAHFSVSRRDSSRNASGVLGAVSAPSALKRSPSAGLASAV